MLIPPTTTDPADWAAFLKRRAAYLRAQQVLEQGARRRALRKHLGETPCL